MSVVAVVVVVAVLVAVAVAIVVVVVAGYCYVIAAVIYYVDFFLWSLLFVLLFEASVCLLV